MPNIVSKTSKQVESGKRIEISKAIKYHEWSPCLKVIYRKTKMIKKNINIIVCGELLHINNFFDNL